MAVSGYMGLDLSLTSTGVAAEGETWTLKPKCRGVARLEEIAGDVSTAVTTLGITLVAIEGYAFGARGSAVFNIGELGGVVRLTLHRMGVAFVEIPPSCLKKYATGKGNANKDDMLAAAIRRFGFEGHGNDEADAWLLLQATLAAYGKRPFTAAQAAALAKVEWPGECVWRRSA